MIIDYAYFCVSGFALGILLGFLATCIYHVINAFFRWARS